MTSTAAPLETAPDQLELILAEAAAASDAVAESSGAVRRAALIAVADAIEADAEALARLGDEETRLGVARMHADIARSTAQLRLFARVCEQGEYLDVRIDEPTDRWNGAARPDLRRMMVALGPVVVFAAGNFPFSFSVAGGDTASALAAGCPVVVKAHPGHARLSARVGELVGSALERAGLPGGSFAVVFGDQAGRQALTDPRVTAGAFTGSTGVGRLLFELAATRPDPIPFYGELGSVNPVFVTRAALRQRREAILTGYVDSFTFGAGQLCTKPGLLFLPDDAAARDELAALVAARQPAPLLGERIHAGFVEGVAALAGQPWITELVGSSGSDELPGPTLLATTAAELGEHAEQLIHECFGPASVVISCTEDSDLATAAALFPGQLTGTIHAEPGDDVEELVRQLRRRAGRLVWNGWPTGVAVSWATQHGGPYPATTSALHTSVGAQAITRFLRPVCYQAFPDDRLPAALRDANPDGVPRRVDPGPR